MPTGHTFILKSLNLQKFAGEYCPEGSSAPLDCDPGYYCDVNEMNSPRAMCAAGYYCISRATTDRPTDGATG